MQSMPRFYRHSLLGLAAACMGAGLGLSLSGVARAQDLQAPRDKANRICASYGQGFVAGPTPGHCVKVEERLRVAPAARHTHLDESAGGFVSAQDAPLRDRLRVNGGFGGGTIR